MSNIIQLGDHIDPQVNKGLADLRHNGKNGFVLLVKQDDNSVSYLAKTTMPEMLGYTMNMMNLLDSESQIKAITHLSKVAMATAAKAMEEADDLTE